MFQIVISKKVEPSLYMKDGRLPKVVHATSVSMKHGHGTGPRSGNASFPWVRMFVACIHQITLLEHKGCSICDITKHGDR
jgi:hypothetical protein